MARYLLFAILGSPCAVLASWPAYDEVDANHDGKIDAVEAERVVGLNFRTADLDQDLVISREEYAKVVNAPAPPSMLIVQ